MSPQYSHDLPYHSDHLAVGVCLVSQPGGLFDCHDLLIHSPATKVQAHRSDVTIQSRTALVVAGS